MDPSLGLFVTHLWKYYPWNQELLSLISILENTAGKNNLKTFLKLNTFRLDDQMLKICFDIFRASENCFITCVEEVDFYPNICILAVATEFTGNGANAGVLSIFCVHGSKVLGSIDFCERISSIRYISQAACEKSVLKYFRGSVAVGTDQGKLFLIDLMIPDTHRKSKYFNYATNDLIIYFQKSRCHQTMTPSCFPVNIFSLMSSRIK